MDISVVPLRMALYVDIDTVIDYLSKKLPLLIVCLAVVKSKQVSFFLVSPQKDLKKNQPNKKQTRENTP